MNKNVIFAENIPGCCNTSTLDPKLLCFELSLCFASLVWGSLQWGHLTICKKEGMWHIKQTNQTHLWQKCPVSLYRRCRDLYLFRRWLANPKHEVDYRVASSPCSCSLPNFLAASYFTAAVQLLAQTLISEGPTAAQWFVLSFFFPVHLADHVDLYIFELPKFFDLPDFSDPWSSKNQPTLQMVKLS